jgi:hypothetical protein
MTKHETRSFAESLISSNVEPFSMGLRISRNASPRPVDQRADKFVMVAVLAFVIGFLSLFTFAASKNAPETVAKDTALTAMYGP